MSDEEIKDLYNGFDKCINRIEVLEKTIESMVKTDTSNQDRIIALENKYKQLDRLSIGRRDDLSNQIVDLQEGLDTVDGAYRRLEVGIAELKEHIHQLIMGQDSNSFIAVANKEVLRDSIYTSRNAFLQIKAVLKDSDLLKASTVAESYNEQLEKLDSPTSPDPYYPCGKLKIEKKEAEPLNEKAITEYNRGFENGYNYAEEKLIEPENDDKIIGVETICPMCEYKLYYWFKSGKALIGEFLEDLLHYPVDDVIKKWQEK